MDKFENYIKNSLENYEAEYNPADWADLEKKLEQKERISKITKGITYSTVVLIATGLILFFNKPEDESPKTEDKIVKIQPIENVISENTISEENNAIPELQKIEIKEPQHTPNSQNSPEKNKLKKEEVLPLQTEISTNKKLSEISSQEKSEIRNPKSEIQNHPAPKANFSSAQNTVCANSVGQFNVEKNEIPVEYRWDFGDGNSSSEENPKHIFKNAGTFSIKLQVISQLDKKSDVQTNTITVNPAPIADFNWKFSSNENPTILFESNQEDIAEWNWDFGDNQFSTEEKPMHIYGKRGNYSASLRMKNNYGCTTSCRKNVNVVNDFNLLAPNAFSPNGDGKNDTWLPIALIDGDYIFSLTILDRTGNVAYKTNSKNNPWDGHHLKTNDWVKTSETFTWIAVVKDKNGTESTYGGVITITESMGY